MLSEYLCIISRKKKCPEMSLFLCIITRRERKNHRVPKDSRLLPRDSGIQDEKLKPTHPKLAEKDVGAF